MRFLQNACEGGNMLTIKTPLEIAKRKQQYGLTLSSKDRAQLILFGEQGDTEALTRAMIERDNEQITKQEANNARN